MATLIQWTSQLRWFLLWVCLLPLPFAGPACGKASMDSRDVCAGTQRWICTHTPTHTVRHDQPHGHQSKLCPSDTLTNTHSALLSSWWGQDLAGGHTVSQTTHLYIMGSRTGFTHVVCPGARPRSLLPLLLALVLLSYIHTQSWQFWYPYIDNLIFYGITCYCFVRLFSPQRPPVLPFKYTCSLVVLTGLLSSRPFCPFCHLLMLFFTGSNNFLCCVQLNLRPAHLSVCHNIVTPCVCVQIMYVVCMLFDWLGCCLGDCPFSSTLGNCRILYYRLFHVFSIISIKILLFYWFISCLMPEHCFLFLFPF